MSSWIDTVPETLPRRRRASRWFATACRLVTWSGVVLLAVLLIDVSRDGLRWLDWEFLSSFPSRFPERAGGASA